MVEHDEVSKLLEAWAAQPDPADSPRREILEFAEVFLKVAAGSDLSAQPADRVAAAIVSLFEQMRQRPLDQARVRVGSLELANPDNDDAGTNPAAGTVIDLVVDDCDYIIESVLLTLRRFGCNVQSMMNAVVGVARDPQGALVDFAAAPGAAARPGSPAAAGDHRRESVVHIVIDPIADAARRGDLELALSQALDSVLVVSTTWPEMRQRLLAAAAALAPSDPLGGQLLTWFAKDNFLFFGACSPDPDVADIGLCGLSDWKPLPLIEQPHPGVMIVESKRRATVHRAAPLMRIVVWIPDDGTGSGERREEYFGLFPAHVYTLPVARLPLVGGRVDEVIERAGFVTGGHNERHLRSLMESYPREELFQIDTDTLFEHSIGLLNLQDTERVRIFARQSRSGRFVSVLAFVPRDRFDTHTRVEVVQAIADAYGSSEPNFAVLMGDGPFARLHVRAHAPDGEVLNEVDAAPLEAELTAITEGWVDGVGRALKAQLGFGPGAALASEWADGFPEGYRSCRTAAQTVVDIGILTALDEDDLAIELSQPGIDGLIDGLDARPVPSPDAPPGTGEVAASESQADLRVTLYRSGGPLTLSAMLPLLQDLGMTVLDEHPYELVSASGVRRWIYDVGVRARSGAPSIADRESFEAALLAVWQGEAESDGFGALVLGAGISWRDVAVLRAYRRYLRQIGSTFSQIYFEQTLLGNPDIVTQLVEYFHTRFAPHFEGSEADRAAAETELAAAIDRSLERIVSLDEDRMLRGFKMLIGATDRTNAFVPEAETLAFKLDPARIDDLPLPVPAHEIWVYAPRVEGVHLRGGAVARGGLRHSDRREDFRTEVLGLMKAQQVKNSVIVPVGAKGGFVCHQLPENDRAAAHEEAVACYRMFIAGLLDVTDNIVAGEVVPPAGVVRHDGDDPYLVVAADKGTATFSDFANEVSMARGFWLGDAFASGGSTGYDHKAMGITARGAWESVRRHLYELGIDSQRDPVRVVGIGDMSGDVFGNGMLLSPTIELVAAFDHRHVFVDPTPDPVTSAAERQRLFDMPRSSWLDYDPSLISAGGGVFDRGAKAVDVGSKMAAALGIEAGEMTPNELMRAILRAPVDLFWNGGIGTFVKASDETHLEVGDRTNDGIRLDATELRVKVVGEGGNLGLTQRARIEFAMLGGSINTDAIDNSAGVDTSDHEVNLKVLLNQVVDRQQLTVDARNELLASMTDEVAAQVLVDNVEQNVALSMAHANSLSMAAVHRRMMAVLEADASLIREVEFLPTDEALVERARDGHGLSRPELAVLLAYEKNRLTELLTADDLAGDPAFAETLDDYFPEQIPESLRAAIATHPLASNIVATAVVNQMVNRAGLTMVMRLVQETGASVAEVVRAHRVAWLVGDIERAWQELSDLAPGVAAETQLRGFLELRRLAERSTRWVLRHRSDLSDPASLAGQLRPGVDALASELRPKLPPRQRQRLAADSRAFVEAGLPADLADRVVWAPMAVPTLDQVDLALSRSVDLAAVAEVWSGVGDRLHLDWLDRQVTALDRSDHWMAMARTASRSDVATARRELVAAVLDAGGDSSGGEGADVDNGGGGTVGLAAVKDWLARNRPHTGRYESLVADLRASESVELSHITVAVGELRDVLAKVTGAAG